MFRLMRRSLRPHRGSVAAIVALQTLDVVAVLMLPTLNARVIDDGIVRGDLGVIRDTGLAMLAVAVVGLAATLLVQRLCAQVAMGVGHQLRTELVTRVGRLSGLEIGRFGTASLTTRTINDVQQIQVLVMTALTDILATPAMCVVGVILALQQDVALAGWLVVALVVTIAPIAVTLTRMGPRYERIQATLDRIARILGEQITGIRVVRAFGREDAERARFDAENAELHGLMLAVNRMGAMLFPAVVLFGNLFAVLIIWIGSGHVGSGRIPVGALTAFLGYLVLILTSIMIALYVMVGLPRAQVAARRVSEVLDIAPAVNRDGTGRPAGARVEFRGAELRHPGADAPFLSEIGLVVEPGETVAVLGSTGSGKSTLLSLVPRLVDVTAGAVLVGGVDVRDLHPDALSDTVGLIPQNATLFAGTVASNLRFGAPDASDVQLWEALTVAAAAGFVAELPGGLDAEVMPGGRNLSGGQRQRLAIARTVLREPAVYLLDDCFSALDRATEAAVSAALAARTAGAAVLLVAQRMDAVEHADRIVVLEHGRCVGIGTHAELLAGNAVYQEIAASQQAREEISS